MSTPNSITVSGSLTLSSYAFVQFTRSDLYEKCSPFRHDGSSALRSVVFAPNSWAQQRAPILDQVAKAYGIDSWDQVEAVRYTWNGEITGLFKAAHKWEWEPKTNKVTFEGVGKDGKPVKVSYVRTDPAPKTTP